MTVLIFSVSIGRRLMDPLAEFVKYDPKHLGVGQYQVPRALSKLTNKKCSQDYVVNYLSCNNVKPLLGTKTYARQAAGILVKLKIKNEGGCNQYTLTKQLYPVLLNAL